ncbi:hypothetical protein ACFSL6_18900 [Paenibacillus thailandensis]|uniref:Zinc ribbon domain-containing protein n=1 Tax=Paenibacillus thailandensis TaxID=393250 RepID=A0ABW5QS02_9BACL
MFCPVCNGMEPLTAVCAKCGNTADDLGRITDLKGPYSPYEPISVMMHIMLEGECEGICRHVCSCSRCRDVFEVNVAEWH